MVVFIDWVGFQQFSTCSRLKKKQEKDDCPILLAIFLLFSSQESQNSQKLTKLPRHLLVKDTKATESSKVGRFFWKARCEFKVQVAVVIEHLM